MGIANRAVPGEIGGGQNGGIGAVRFEVHAVHLALGTVGEQVEPGQVLIVNVVQVEYQHLSPVHDHLRGVLLAHGLALRKVLLVYTIRQPIVAADQDLGLPVAGHNGGIGVHHGAVAQLAAGVAAPVPHVAVAPDHAHVGRARGQIDHVGEGRLAGAGVGAVALRHQRGDVRPGGNGVGLVPAQLTMEVGAPGVDLPAAHGGGAVSAGGHGSGPGHVGLHRCCKGNFIARRGTPLLRGAGGIDRAHTGGVAALAIGAVAPGVDQAGGQQSHRVAAARADGQHVVQPSVVQPALAVGAHIVSALLHLDGHPVIEDIPGTQLALAVIAPAEHGAVRAEGQGMAVPGGDGDDVIQVDPLGRVVALAHLGGEGHVTVIDRLGEGGLAGEHLAGGDLVLLLLIGGQLRQVHIVIVELHQSGDVLVVLHIIKEVHIGERTGQGAVRAELIAADQAGVAHAQLTLVIVAEAPDSPLGSEQHTITLSGGGLDDAVRQGLYLYSLIFAGHIQGAQPQLAVLVGAPGPNRAVGGHGQSMVTARCDGHDPGEHLLTAVGGVEVNHVHRSVAVLLCQVGAQLAMLVGAPGPHGSVGLECHAEVAAQGEGGSGLDLGAGGPAGLDRVHLHHEHGGELVAPGGGIGVVETDGRLAGAHRVEQDAAGIGGDRHDGGVGGLDLEHAAAHGIGLGVLGVLHGPEVAEVVLHRAADVHLVAGAQLHQIAQLTAGGTGGIAAGHRVGGSGDPPAGPPGGGGVTIIIGSDAGNLRQRVGIVLRGNSALGDLRRRGALLFLRGRLLLSRRGSLLRGSVGHGHGSPIGGSLVLIQESSGGRGGDEFHSDVHSPVQAGHLEHGIHRIVVPLRRIPGIGGRSRKGNRLAGRKDHATAGEAGPDHAGSQGDLQGAAAGGDGVIHSIVEGAAGGGLGIVGADHQGLLLHDAGEAVVQSPAAHGQGDLADAVRIVVRHRIVVAHRHAVHPQGEGPPVGLRIGPERGPTVQVQFQRAVPVEKVQTIVQAVPNRNAVYLYTIVADIVGTGRRAAGIDAGVPGGIGEGGGGDARIGDQRDHVAQGGSVGPGSGGAVVLEVHRHLVGVVIAHDLAVDRGDPGLAVAGVRHIVVPLAQRELAQLAPVVGAPSIHVARFIQSPGEPVAGGHPVDGPALQRGDSADLPIAAVAGHERAILAQLAPAVVAEAIDTAGGQGAVLIIMSPDDNGMVLAGGNSHAVGDDVGPLFQVHGRAVLQHAGIVDRAQLAVCIVTEGTDAVGGGPVVGPDHHEGVVVARGHIHHAAHDRVARDGGQAQAGHILVAGGDAQLAPGIVAPGHQGGDIAAVAAVAAQRHGVPAAGKDLLGPFQVAAVGVGLIHHLGGIVPAPVHHLHAGAEVLALAQLATLAVAPGIDELVRLAQIGQRVEPAGGDAGGAHQVSAAQGQVARMDLGGSGAVVEILQAQLATVVPAPGVHRAVTGPGQHMVEAHRDLFDQVQLVGLAVHTLHLNGVCGKGDFLARCAHAQLAIGVVAPGPHRAVGLQGHGKALAAPDAGVGEVIGVLDLHGEPTGVDKGVGIGQHLGHRDVAGAEAAVALAGGGGQLPVVGRRVPSHLAGGDNNGVAGIVGELIRFPHVVRYGTIPFPQVETNAVITGDALFEDSDMLTVRDGQAGQKLGLGNGQGIGIGLLIDAQLIGVAGGKGGGEHRAGILVHVVGVDPHLIENEIAVDIVADPVDDTHVVLIIKGLAQAQLLAGVVSRGVDHAALKYDNGEVGAGGDLVDPGLVILVQIPVYRQVGVFRGPHQLRHRLAGGAAGAGGHGGGAEAQLAVGVGAPGKEGALVGAAQGKLIAGGDPHHTALQQGGGFPAHLGGGGLVHLVVAAHLAVAVGAPAPGHGGGELLAAAVFEVDAQRGAVAVRGLAPLAHAAVDVQVHHAAQAAENRGGQNGLVGVGIAQTQLTAAVVAPAVHVAVPVQGAGKVRAQRDGDDVFQVRQVPAGILGPHQDGQTRHPVRGAAAGPGIGGVLPLSQLAHAVVAPGIDPAVSRDRHGDVAPGGDGDDIGQVPLAVGVQAVFRTPDLDGVVGVGDVVLAQLAPAVVAPDPDGAVGGKSHGVLIARGHRHDIAQRGQRAAGFGAVDGHGSIDIRGGAAADGDAGQLFAAVPAPALDRTIGEKSQGVAVAGGHHGHRVFGVGVAGVGAALGISPPDLQLHDAEGGHTADVAAGVNSGPPLAHGPDLRGAVHHLGHPPVQHHDVAAVGRGADKGTQIAAHVQLLARHHAQVPLHRIRCRVVQGGTVEGGLDVDVGHGGAAGTAGEGAGRFRRCGVPVVLIRVGLVFPLRRVLVPGGGVAVLSGVGPRLGLPHSGEIDGGAICSDALVGFQRDAEHGLQELRPSGRACPGGFLTAGGRLRAGGGRLSLFGLRLGGHGDFALFKLHLAALGGRRADRGSLLRGRTDRGGRGLGGLRRGGRGSPLFLAQQVEAAGLGGGRRGGGALGLLPAKDGQIVIGVLLGQALAVQLAEELLDLRGLVVNALGAGGVLRVGPVEKLLGQIRIGEGPGAGRLGGLLPGPGHLDPAGDHGGGGLAGVVDGPAHRLKGELVAVILLAEHGLPHKLLLQLELGLRLGAQAQASGLVQGRHILALVPAEILHPLQIQGGGEKGGILLYAQQPKVLDVSHVGGDFRLLIALGKADAGFIQHQGHRNLSPLQIGLGGGCLYVCLIPGLGLLGGLYHGRRARPADPRQQGERHGCS